MNELEYIINKFNINVNEPSPFYINNFGRHKDLPRLFNELGFKVGAEIGVFEGAFSERLLRYNPSLKLFGVDLWESYPGYKDFEKHTILESYTKALDIVKGYDCTYIKGWSHEVVNQFEDESLDFVFIDCNHAYEFVVADIANWSKKVRIGGIVCGHDYHDYSKSKKWQQMQVFSAVNGWMQAYKIHPWFVLTKHHCWMYVKSVFTDVKINLDRRVQYKIDK